MTVAKLRAAMAEVATILEKLKEDALARVPDSGDDEARRLKALIYKLDTALELLVARLSDETSPTNDNTGVVPTPDSLSSNESSTASAVVRLEAQPPPPTKKAAPKAPAKAAPPLAKGKRPPPAAKKPPPVPGGSQEDDAELKPEKKPRDDLLPRPLQWVGIPKNRVAGSFWDCLLNKDRELPPAKQVRDSLPRSPSSGCVQRRSNEQSNAGGSLSALRRLPGDEPVSCLESEFRFEPNYELIESLFFEKKCDKKTSGGSTISSNSGETNALADGVFQASCWRKVSLLPPGDAKCVELTLRGLKLNENGGQEIRSLVLDLDSPLFLSDDPPAGAENEWQEMRRQIEDRLVATLRFYPKPEVQHTLKPLMQDTSKAALADRFLLELGRIPHCKERAAALLTKLRFAKDHRAMAEKITRLKVIASTVIASLKGGILKSIFALILRIGNFVNYTTKKPLVAGLQLQSLEILKSYRSVDGSKTFIRIIAEHVEEQFDIGWSQLEFLPQCLEVADVSPDEISKERIAMVQKMKSIEALLEQASDDSRFQHVFKSFVQTANEKLSSLDALTQETNDLLQELAAFLSDKAKGPKEGLETLEKLGGFGKDLFQAKKELENEKQSIEKKRARTMFRNSAPQTPVLASESRARQMSTPRSAGPNSCDIVGRRTPQMKKAAGSERVGPPERPVYTNADRSGIERTSIETNSIVSAIDELRPPKAPSVERLPARHSQAPELDGQPSAPHHYSAANTQNRRTHERVVSLQQEKGGRSPRQDKSRVRDEVTSGLLFPVTTRCVEESAREAVVLRPLQSAINISNRRREEMSRREDLCTTPPPTESTRMSQLETARMWLDANIGDVRLQSASSRTKPRKTVHYSSGSMMDYNHDHEKQQLPAETFCGDHRASVNAPSSFASERQLPEIYSNLRPDSALRSDRPDNVRHDQSNRQGSATDQGRHKSSRSHAFLNTEEHVRATLSPETLRRFEEWQPHRSAHLMGQNAHLAAAAAQHMSFAAMNAPCVANSPAGGTPQVASSQMSPLLQRPRPLGGGIFPRFPYPYGPGSCSTSGWQEDARWQHDETRWHQADVNDCGVRYVNKSRRPDSEAPPPFWKP